MKLVLPTDPVLWAPARPVTNIAAEVLPHLPALRQLCLLIGHALAVAAPQVGLSSRFFIVCGGTRGLQCRTVINPVITLRSPEQASAQEGCLSAPGVFKTVGRSKRIVVEYTDEHELSIGPLVLEGLEARVFQHEFDHLEGICIFDRPA